MSGDGVSARFELRNVFARAEVRRLLVCLALGVLLAVMSGPQGRTTQPSYAITHALAPGRLWHYLLVGVVLWVIVDVYSRGSGVIRNAWQPISRRGETAWGNWQTKLGLNAVLLALAIIAPLVLDSAWNEVLVDDVAIYALLALGLNVVVGFAGLLDLGYIAFYAIGAYVSAYFTDTLPTHPPFTINPFYTIPLAVLAAMIAGLVLGGPTLRLRGDYLAIVTLGFGEIITILAVNLSSITNGPRGAYGIPSLSFDFKKIGVHSAYDFNSENRPYYYFALGVIVIVMVLFTLLENSKVGRAWTAIREDEVAAQACGIPTVKYKLMAFAIGASTSGLAGVIYASKISYINPSDFTVGFSILALVLVIFGGMGSIYGAVVGAAVVQSLLDYLRLHNVIDPGDTYLYVGAILIVMMIFRPQGLVPSRRRSREIGLAEHGVGGADATGAPAGGPVS